MNTLVKIYSAACAVVVGFVFLLHVPWGLMPFSDAVNVTLVGGSILALAAFYISYFYRREGFEFGWFLARRSGIWVIALIAIGVVLTAGGILLYAWPELFTPAIERGLLPIGVLVVRCFGWR